MPENRFALELAQSIAFYIPVDPGSGALVHIAASNGAASAVRIAIDAHGGWASHSRHRGPDGKLLHLVATRHSCAVFAAPDSLPLTAVFNPDTLSCSPIAMVQVAPLPISPAAQRTALLEALGSWTDDQGLPGLPPDDLLVRGQLTTLQAGYLTMMANRLEDLGGASAHAIDRRAFSSVATG